MLDAEIVHGQHVGTAEREEHENFGRPAANSLHRGQAFHDYVVLHPAEVREGEFAGRGARGDVANVADFLAGEAGGAEFPNGGGEDPLGLGKSGVAIRAVASVNGEEARFDGARGMPGNLLGDDGADQCAQGIRLHAFVEKAGANADDDTAHDGIGAFQVADSGAMGHGEPTVRERLGRCKSNGAARNASQGRFRARIAGVTAFNYFNYFTEIEEYFWRKRGAQILVSPLDWAILESWQKASIPVEVVLKGIDAAFESYARSRRGASGRPLKSLAYCVDAVLDAAVAAQEAAAGRGPETESAGTGRAASQPFSPGELAAYLARNAERMREAANRAGREPSSGGELLARRIAETVARVEECRARLDGAEGLDLEDLERRLTVMEDGLYAALQSAADQTAVLEIRREMDRQLAPYRRKMTAAQLTMLEQQFMRRRLMEAYGLPRLSLFYLT